MMTVVEIMLYILGIVILYVGGVVTGILIMRNNEERAKETESEIGILLRQLKGLLENLLSK